MILPSEFRNFKLLFQCCFKKADMKLLIMSELNIPLKTDLNLFLLDEREKCPVVL